MLGDQVLTIYRGRLDFRDAEFSEEPVIAKLPPCASAILENGLPVITKLEPKREG